MAKAEQIPGFLGSLSAGSFAQSSLGHSSAEMPRVTLSCLFVWAASQAASSRNNRIFSFVCSGKIKCDLNSLLDLHQMSPPGHELSGSRGGAALPSTARTFPAKAAEAARPGDHLRSFRSLSDRFRRLPGLPAAEEADGLRPASSSTCGESKRHGTPTSVCSGMHLQHTHAHLLPSLPRELGCPPQNSLDSGPSHEFCFGPAPGP